MLLPFSSWKIFVRLMPDNFSLVLESSSGACWTFWNNIELKLKLLFAGPPLKLTLCKPKKWEHRGRVRWRLFTKWHEGSLCILSKWKRHKTDWTKSQNGDKSVSNLTTSTDTRTEIWETKSETKTTNVGLFWLPWLNHFCPKVFARFFRRPSKFDANG